jgi:hypothetical protein
MGTEAAVDPIARGEEALRSGDWDAARESFAAALERAETPEALDGLGRTLWWLGDVDGAIEHRERAYVGHRERGEGDRAAERPEWIAAFLEMKTVWHPIGV